MPLEKWWTSSPTKIANLTDNNQRSIFFERIALWHFLIVIREPVETSFRAEVPNSLNETHQILILNEFILDPKKLHASVWKQSINTQILRCRLTHLSQISIHRFTYSTFTPRPNVSSNKTFPSPKFLHFSNYHYISLH